MMRRKILNPNGFPEWVDVADAHEIAYALMSDIAIGHKFDDVMTHVPPMTFREVYYELPKKHLAMYKAFEKLGALELDGADVSATNAGVFASKLLQIASGAVYHDAAPGQRAGWSIVDTGRYELIADLVEARDASVVFTTWDHQRDELVRAFKKRRIPYLEMLSSMSGERRGDIVRRFQGGEGRAVLLHPKLGAHGLTFTRALTTIYASPQYNADIIEQGDARVRRGMQDKPTERIVVLAAGTRDLHAYEVFVGRKRRMEALNELLQNPQSS